MQALCVPGVCGTLSVRPAETASTVSCVNVAEQIVQRFDWFETGGRWK